MPRTVLLLCVAAAFFTGGLALWALKAYGSESRAFPHPYASFERLQAELHTFEPEGFSGVSPGVPEFYGFAPELAWGKREHTSIEGHKPSQFRYVLVSQDRDVAVLIQVMYTRTPMTRDMIGIVALPDKETFAAGDGTVELKGLPRSLQLFAYDNLIFVLEAYQMGETPVDGDRLAEVGLGVGLAFRQFLTNQPYLR